MDEIESLAQRLVQQLVVADRQATDPKLTDALVLARRTLAAVQVARLGK